MGKKIIYVEYRFHTNEAPLARLLVQSGYSIKYVTAVSRYSEDHRVVKPICIGYSKLTKLFEKSEKYGYKFWLPPFKIFKIITDENPALIIIKGFTFATLYLSNILRIMGYTTVISVQRPLLSNKEKISRIIYQRLFGKNVITSVESKLMDNRINRNEYMLGQKWTYLPFIIDIPQKALDRSYFKDNKINVLLIGKFIKRKKIIEFLEMFISHKEYSESIKLTILGSVVDKDLYSKALQLSKTSKNISVRGAIPFEQMESMYLENDILVMPAIEEAASCSQLEAMSYGLSVLCCDDNGTASYIKDGFNGYIINSNDYKKSLNIKFKNIISDRNRIIEMGRNSLELVEKNHSILSYINYIENIIKIE